MKTTKILCLGLLGLASIFGNAQDVSSTAQLTSGGLEAGTTLGSNTFYGYQSGKNNSSSQNTFFGSRSGISSIGNANLIMGIDSGYNLNGDGNCFIGSYCGMFANGNQNILIGSGVGEDLLGSNNIIIGEDNVGYNINNTLIVEKGDFMNPLIWGNFEQDQLKLNGKVGIGFGFGNYPSTAGSINIANYNLFVKGGILTEEVRVSLQSTWADYVFKKDYKLPTLKEVENHIAQKGHLINVPSAEEIKNNGIELGEMSKIQQEKIEELTLYIIEQNKINEKQAKEIEELKIMVKALIKKNN